MIYRCSTCGKTHNGLPDMGIDKPDLWWDVPESERERRIQLTSDTCILDEKDFFIRGIILIPVHNFPDSFCFGVWVSQKRENFYKYLGNPDSKEIGPFFGWIATRLSYYPKDTLKIKTMVHFRSGGLRPSIEIEPSDLPLSLDQRNGISMDKAWDIVHHYQKGKIA